MQNLELNIVQSYAACRKIKKSLIPNKVFEDLNFVHKPQSRISFPGRVITSAEVVRAAENQLVHDFTHDYSKFQDAVETADTDASFKSPAVRPNAMNARLRTPFRPINKSRKFSKLIQNDSGMTKQCDSLFRRMKSMYTPKKSHSFDPRYSVRRVIKKSGLLKALGEPELLDEDELESLEEGDTAESESKSACSSCNGQTITVLLQSNEQEVPKLGAPTPTPPMTTEDFITGLVPPQSPSQFLSMDDNDIIPSSIHRERTLQQSSSFVEQFQSNILSDNEERFYSTIDDTISVLMTPRQSRESPPTTPPLNHQESISLSSSPSSSALSSSNCQYDTVVMKRTVEMQLVQYLPNEDDWEQYHCST